MRMGKKLEQSGSGGQKFDMEQVTEAGNVVYANFMEENMFWLWEKEEAFLICLQKNF